jgi:hypothetical protein
MVARYANRLTISWNKGDVIGKPVEGSIEKRIAPGC